MCILHITYRNGDVKTKRVERLNFDEVCDPNIKDVYVEDED